LSPFKVVSNKTIFDSVTSSKRDSTPNPGVSGFRDGAPADYKQGLYPKEDDKDYGSNVKDKTVTVEERGNENDGAAVWKYEQVQYQHEQGKYRDEQGTYQYDKGTYQYVQGSYAYQDGNHDKESYPDQENKYDAEPYNSHQDQYAGDAGFDEDGGPDYGFDDDEYGDDY
jgi:hypothetical protein